VKAWSFHVNWDVRCLKNLRWTYDGEALSVCMLIPGVSGRITMKHGAMLLVKAPCCGLVGGYWRFGGTCCLRLHSVLKFWACSMFWRNVATFYVLDVHESLHRDTTMKTTNKMQLYRLIYYFKSALRVSGDVFAHHQEHSSVFTVSGSVHPSCCRLLSTRYCKYSQVRLMMGEDITRTT